MLRRQAALDHLSESSRNSGHRARASTLHRADEHPAKDAGADVSGSLGARPQPAAGLSALQDHRDRRGRREMVATMGDRPAALLFGYGAVTALKTLDGAVVDMLELEEQARMNYLAYAAAGADHPFIPRRAHRRRRRASAAADAAAVCQLDARRSAGGAWVWLYHAAASRGARPGAGDSWTLSFRRPPTQRGFQLRPDRLAAAGPPLLQRGVKVAHRPAPCDNVNHPVRKPELDGHALLLIRRALQSDRRVIFPDRTKLLLRILRRVIRAA